MMRIKYKIKWMSKETGKHGEGKPIFNTREMAQASANRLNEQYKYMSHTVATEEVND